MIRDRTGTTTATITMTKELRDRAQNYCKQDDRSLSYVLKKPWSFFLIARIKKAVVILNRVYSKQTKPPHLYYVGLGWFFVLIDTFYLGS
jgi:hypothetical protein